MVAESDGGAGKISHVRTLSGPETGPDVDIQGPMIAAVHNQKYCVASHLVSN